MSHYDTNLMALSPYKSPQSPLNRSRSSSCSSPIRNRIVFQQIYSVGANTLFRSYSCDQVFEKDASGQTFQTTQIQISSFITPEKKFTVKEDLGSPQEVTHKAQRKLEVTAAESSHRKMSETTPKKPSRNILRRTLKYCLLPVLSSCLFYFYMAYRECGYVWDLERTENELTENVFGQTEALTRINSVLRMCSSSNGMSTMVFTGGVGVGKTFSSSIISRNFPWSSNKLITYSESFSADIEKLLSSDLSTCGCNLIVVDDLPGEISSQALKLITLLNNKRKMNEKLLVILIFQIHTETERNAIVEEFKSSYISFYHVPFKSLSQDVVERCFYAEIQRHGVRISSAEFETLVKEKMKYNDIIKGLTGCKGVAEEVSSYYKKGYNDI